MRPKRKRPVDFHQPAVYVLLRTEDLGHVPRPRPALQGRTFSSLPQGAQAPCSWAQNAKGRMIFIIRPFLFCCARRTSVTSRDPVRPCKAGLSRPSRKARRRFARGPQNAKGRMIFINRPFMFCCARRTSVTSRDPVRPCKAGLSRPSRKARRRLARGPQNTKGRLTCVNRPFLFWCPRRDSNPHTSRHMDLNHARLPIPPRGPSANAFKLHCLKDAAF